MRIVKHIALGAALVSGVFSATFYSSCSKDANKSTHCYNDQKPVGGICQCALGLSGNLCETRYRAAYANTYTGNTPGNVGHGVANNTLTFREADTPAVGPNYYNDMNVTWKDTGTTFEINLPIVLSNNTPSGSSFAVTPTPYGSKTYTGGGTISANMASMSLTETDTSGVVKYFTFNNFYKQ